MTDFRSTADKAEVQVPESGAGSDRDHDAQSITEVHCRLLTAEKRIDVALLYFQPIVFLELTCKSPM